MSVSSKVAAVATAAAIAIAPVAKPRLFQFEGKSFEKYGVEWPVVCEHDPLTIELRCYAAGWSEERGGLGKVGHFKEAVNLLWGPDNETKQFIWNPWSERMLEEAVRWKYLSVAGCASSGKSLFFAVYAIINWLCDPVNTTVLITSTSLKESKGRIWADVEDYWNAAQKRWNDALPGKVVSSLGLIKLHDPTGQTQASDRSGIHLIAGEKRKEKESIGKMIGFKNKRLLFVGDELPELSAAILEAATGNLDSSEKEWFQLVGTGNPNSIYDPHGQFSKPKAGWKSITPADMEWETDLGYCIRFDAYQSPNILAGRVLYKWLPTQAKVDAKKEELGEESLAFWRMWRGFWCPTGGSESIISEADLIGFDCESRVKRWKGGQFTRVAFLDPGFTNGGDRSIACFAKFGVSEETGLDTVEFEEYKLLAEDTMNVKEARNFQIAKKYRAECEQRGILPQHAGVDDTGAAAFGDIVHTVWSRLVVRTNFGGAASKLPVSAHNKTLACDKYANRVTEICCSTREFIRGNQVRGVFPDMAIEWTARKLVLKKSGVETKALAESKEKMRSRTGKSPDIADAGNGIMDLLRTKFRFRAAAKQTMNAVTRKTWSSFRKAKDFYGKHTPILDRAA